MSITYNKSYIYFIGLVAGLAGLLFGFDTGVVSGAIGFIVKEYNLTTGMEGLVVSIVMMGAVGGTFVSNFVSRIYGRHRALISAGLLFTIAAIGSALAINEWVLIGTRFFLGIAIGLASYTAPLYLAEISPREMRGRIIAFYQLMIAAGLLASYCSDTLFTPAGLWRWMLGVPAIPALLMLIMALYLPSSPRWLMLKNKVTETKNVLAKILPPQQVEAEFAEIQERIKTDQHTKIGWRAITDSRFRAVMVVGILAQVVQQWTGCNVVLYYAPKIFQLAGLSTPVEQMWGTIAVGAVMMVTTIIAVKYVDHWGRRPILFGGLGMMTVSLGILAIATRHAATNSLWQVIAVLAVLIYIFGFAISLGPIVWIICSEIFPLHARDFGIMLTTATNWIANALLALVFPTFIAVFGNNVFYLFVGVCLLSFYFIYFHVPETKGVSLEHIEANLMAGKKTRYIGH